MIELADAVRALAGEVARGLLCPLVEGALTLIHEFLINNLQEWHQLVARTLEEGTEWGIARVKNLMDAIVKVCRENEVFMRQLVKFGVKPASRVLFEVGSKAAVKTIVTKVAAKKAAKAAAKEAAETWFIKRTFTVVYEQCTKMFVKKAVTTTWKATAKATCKTAANPVGIISDVAQVGCELAGHKELGKRVGQAGNITSGAMMGFVVGGPAGAAVGAAVGGFIWYGGEVAGELLDKVIS